MTNIADYKSLLNYFHMKNIQNVVWKNKRKMEV